MKKKKIDETITEINTIKMANTHKKYTCKYKHEMVSDQVSLQKVIV